MRLDYPDPDLASDAVRLRRWTYGDLACVRAASSDPEIPKGTTVPVPYSDAAGRAYVERQWSRNDDGHALALAIARVHDDEAVGHVYLAVTPFGRQCRLGYWLVPAARREGFGSSAVRLVSHWLLTQTSVHRVVAEVHPDNVASIALLEGCGFSLEGTLREWLWIDGAPEDAVQFSLIPSDLEVT